MNEYIEPEYDKNKFTCPRCNTIAHQIFFNSLVLTITTTPNNNIKSRGVKIENSAHDLAISYCSFCDEYSLWINKELIYPISSNAPYPNEDMPEDIKEDYLEARSIVKLSPRGSCALLRLCLEKLMDYLEVKGNTLSNKINNFVKENSVGKDLEHAFATVRVMGNESVHNNQVLDLKDDSETAMVLFSILNIIIDETITKKKTIDNIYDKLPENKKID